MAERGKFYAAQLRWSNDRTGLEFAPLDSEKGGDTRRMQRLGHYRGGQIVYGQLLQDDLEKDGYGEGCGVVVVALPRRMSDAEILAARDRIEHAVRADADACHDALEDAIAMMRLDERSPDLAAKLRSEARE